MDVRDEKKGGRMATSTAERLKLRDGYHRRKIARARAVSDATVGTQANDLGAARRRRPDALDGRSRGEPRDVSRARPLRPPPTARSSSPCPSASRSWAAARATSSPIAEALDDGRARSSAMLRELATKHGVWIARRRHARARRRAMRSARTTPRSSSTRAATWSRATARSTCSTSTSRAARRCASPTRPRAGDELGRRRHRRRAGRPVDLLRRPLPRALPRARARTAAPRS